MYFLYMQCNVGNCVDAFLLVFFRWTCLYISRCSSSCLYWEWTRRSLRTCRWLERREQCTTQAIELWGNQVQGSSITTASTAYTLLKQKVTDDDNLCPNRKTPWRHSSITDLRGNVLDSLILQVPGRRFRICCACWLL